MRFSISIFYLFIFFQWLKQAHHNETFEKQKSFRNEKFRKIKVQNENYYVFQESPQIFQSPNGDYFSKLVIENVKESHTGKYACCEYKKDLFK